MNKLESSALLCASEVGSEEADLPCDDVFKHKSGHLLANLLDANDFVAWMQLKEEQLLHGDINCDEVWIILAADFEIIRDCDLFIIDAIAAHIQVDDGVPVGKEDVVVEVVDHSVRRPLNDFLTQGPGNSCRCECAWRMLDLLFIDPLLFLLYL